MLVRAPGKVKGWHRNEVHCDQMISFSTSVHPPGGVVGNMLASHDVGIHSDSDDHYNGGPVSLDPQWDNNRSSPSKVKLIGQKHECPSMTLSG